MNAVEIFSVIYLVCFLITIYHIARWLLIALRWQRGYMREHGFLNTLWDCYHPLRGWKFILIIWRDVPGAKAVFMKAFLWLCVTAVVFEFGFWHFQK